MKEMPLDESLAFTARLELAPGLTGEEAAVWQSALLAAWYAQDEVRHFWEFARQWSREFDSEFLALTMNGDSTTLAELLTEFPGMTEADFRELRSGATDWQQATDRAGYTYRIWWDRRADGLIAIPA